MRGDLGQESTRRCNECGELLAIDDGELCAQCRPQLSLRAQAVGELRRRQRDDLAARERAVSELEILIRRLDKKVRRYGNTI